MKSRWIRRSKVLIAMAVLAGAGPAARGQQGAPAKSKWTAREVSLGKVDRDVDVDDLRVAPDGKRLIYVGQRAGKQFVALAGSATKLYDVVGGPSISPDGRRVAYAAQRGSKWCMVVDGVEGKLV